MNSKTCDGCGEAFLPKKSGQRSCSRSCSRRHVWAIRRNADGESKICSGCKQRKPFGAFNFHKDGYLGRNPQCKSCLSTSDRHPVHVRPFNEAFFDVWSDELAWLVGLIWSDGNLQRNSNRFTIGSKDHALLSDVVRIIDQPNGVTPARPGFWRISVSSRRSADFLRSIGLVPKKSHVARWPIIPQEWEAAFVRGLFDGDGSVSFARLTPTAVPTLHSSFCGAAPALMTSLSAWLTSRGVRHGTHVKTGGGFPLVSGKPNTSSVFYLIPTSQEANRRLYGLLYPSPDVVCLQRKRDRFEQWLATPRRPRGPQRATHCMRGHPFDKVNTLIQHDGNRETRQCRACNRLRKERRNGGHPVKV